MEFGDGAAASERLHALDSVRGFALLLGIVFHATWSFVPAPAHIWVVEDSHPSTALAVFFFTSHVFRMTTFFLVAGFFAHMSFHRWGAKAFICDRLNRIALPLVIGWPIVFAAVVVVYFWAHIASNGGHRFRTVSLSTFPKFPLIHLWFLYVLLEFYVGVLILRCGVALIDRKGRIRASVDRLIRLVIHNPFGPIVLAAPLSVTFVIDLKWQMWFGIPAPAASFVTNLQALVGYGTAFSFGWLLHRQTTLIRMLERRWALNLCFAIGLITACLAIAGMTPQLTSTRDEAATFVGAACYALATWTATFAVIGLALRFLSGFSPVRRYIADASYWLYLVHLPVVMALQVAVSRLDWPWPAKFAAILAVAFPLMFASYQLLVRQRFIGGVLNGRHAPLFTRSTRRRGRPSMMSPSPTSAGRTFSVSS